MFEHVLATFGQYGKNYAYPATTPTGYGWRLACDLPAEFEFLKTKALVAPETTIRSKEEFIEGLSGFGDAEGHVGLSGSGRWARGRFTVSNRVPRIIWSFKQGLESMGFHASVYVLARNAIPQYVLEVVGDSAIGLVSMLKFRHPEKIAAKQLVLRYHGSPWEWAERVYRKFRENIKSQRDEFVRLAEVAYGIWPLRKAQRRAELKERMGRAIAMRKAGQGINEVMGQFDCSERTVYRYLASAQSDRSWR